MQLSAAPWGSVVRVAGALSCALLFAGACATPAGRDGAGGALGAGGAGAGARPETLEFELTDVAGKTVRTQDFAGRVVLVDLWATWCRPCEHSMPFYADLYQRLGPQGFSVLAVSVDQHDEEVASFLKRRPLPFPVLRDPAGQVPAKLDVAIETMPTAILIGRDGKIALVHAGFTTGDEEKIEAEVKHALEKPAARPAMKPAPATSPVIEDAAPGDAPRETQADAPKETETP